MADHIGLFLSGLVITVVFFLFLGAVDGTAEAATVVVLPIAGFGLAGLALVLRFRANRVLARIPTARTGMVSAGGVMAFDDGQLPRHTNVRGRVTGPAVAISEARVVPGLRGEALMRWRNRLRRWTNVAVGSLMLGAAPLLAAALLDVVA